MTFQNTLSFVYFVVIPSCLKQLHFVDKKLHPAPALLMITSSSKSPQLHLHQCSHGYKVRCVIRLVSSFLILSRDDCGQVQTVWVEIIG